ncbi:unnamed protein product, partial [Porites lobata]
SYGKNQSREINDEPSSAMATIDHSGQLYGFITVQQEIPSQRSGMKKLMEKDYIGGNGIKQGLSRNLRVTLLQNDSEKETLTRRKKRISKKPKKRRNVTEQEKPSSNESGTRNAVKNIKIPSKELIAWDPHADTQVYLFDNKEHNDPNISGLENADSIRDAKRKNATYVHHRNSAIKRKTKASFKVPPRDASSPESRSDPTQENDTVYHWTIEHLPPVVYVTFTLGIIFGCTLRPHFLSLMYSLYVNLADLPFHVEEFFIKKLDVRCPGQRFYGWQKVGEAFHIDKDDLRYLKIEYKRDNGSPTSKLFEMLGKKQNRNVSDLVEVLRSPERRRSDIVSVIKLT